MHNKGIKYCAPHTAQLQILQHDTADVTYTSTAVYSCALYIFKPMTDKR